jgi:hypothetical protein
MLCYDCVDNNDMDIKGSTGNRREHVIRLRSNCSNIYISMQVF